VLTGLMAVADNDDIAFRWEPDAAAIDYHVNSVSSKTDVEPPLPHRPPATGGVAAAVCQAAAPALTCVEPFALLDPTLVIYYQALPACGDLGRLEGPTR